MAKNDENITELQANKDLHHVLSYFFEKDKREARSRRIRFWALFILSFGMVIYYLYTINNLFGLKDVLSPSSSYVSLIKIEGEIGASGQTKNILKINHALEKAYKDKGSKGVLLLIDSPGGSPVVSQLIHDRIKALKKFHNKKTVAVGLSYMTSGAYMIAAAADEIYAQNTSMVGSIGVIASKFNFSRTIEHFNIERHVQHAGENKARFDPFLPVSSSDTAKLDVLLNKIHVYFKDLVKNDRQIKKENYDIVFSGDFWMGEDAKKYGLIDGIMSPSAVANDIFKAKTFKDDSVKPEFSIRRLFSASINNIFKSLINSSINNELEFK